MNQFTCFKCGRSDLKYINDICPTCFKKMIEFIIKEFRESSLSGALDYEEYWDVVFPKFLEETIKGVLE